MRLVEEETTIKLYEGNHEDSILLFQWWMELVESGDMDLILFPATQPLGPFMSYFQTGKVRLVYSTDPSNRIQAAFWGEPIAPGIIFLSVWGRKSLRFTKQGVQILLDVYKQVFSLFHIIFGITKQERLLKVHKKLGYKIIGKLPQLWGGVEEGWLVMLTREDFFAACGKDL